MIAVSFAFTSEISGFALSTMNARTISLVALLALSIPITCRYQVPSHSLFVPIPLAEESVPETRFIATNLSPSLAATFPSSQPEALLAIAVPF